MILHFVLFLSCAIYASAQEQTLAVRLAYQPVCDYTTMINSFNATNMNGKLDGTGGPYMLFAICDPASGPLPLYTVDQLNYHLGLGELSYDELPEDGFIPTELVDNFIRITHYAGVPFANGERRLSNTALSDYYGPADVIKGSFYRLDSNIVTGKSGPMTPPDKRTILEVIQDDTLFPSNSLVSAMFVPLSPAFEPPSTTSWTFLAPVDAVFDTIPKYQREFLLSGVGSYSLLYNHVINGTYFAAPLAKISSERTGTAQATYEYLLTETGKNLTMRYAYQSKVFYVENKLLNKTDYHCSDGVIHIINDFMFFDEISKSLPPPTPQEFVEQYGLATFPLFLKQSLGFDPTNQATAVSKYIDLIKNSGVIIPNIEVTLFMIWDTSLTTLGTTTLSERLVNYLILPGQFRLADLPHDTLLDTLYAPESLRISVFDDGATYYVNGFATIVKSDLILNKATIHIIDTPFLLAPPCQPTDIGCENNEGWINSTIAESIKGQADCSIWVGLLEKAGYSISAPYTLFLIPDSVFGVFGEDGPALKDYLNADATFLQEYVKKFYLDGTLYPNIAKQSDWNVAAKDGTTYKFTTVAGSKKIFINDLYQGDAYIRNDGIFYVITLTNAGDLFPFVLPETPVEPTPGPVAPPSEIPDPVKPDNSALRMNGIQIWFYLFFVLAILFLM